MSIKNPPDPGRTIREDCIEALGLTIAEAAAHLQIKKAVLSASYDCRAPTTAEMAARFEQAFGGTADAWVQMQAARGPVRARKTGRTDNPITRTAPGV